MIRRGYLPRLKAIYQKAQKKDKPHDKITLKYQGWDRWYALWPHLMHQAPGYSDIEKKSVDYPYLSDDGRVMQHW